MSTDDQQLNTTRYQITPRVLIFAFRQDDVLLIKLLPKSGKQTTWTGKYNGPGGHVERREDILSAARREFREETGLDGDFSLCGTLMVDVSQLVGIGLFIFQVKNVVGEIISSHEGLPEWLPMNQLEKFPLVEDVPIILEKIRNMKPDSPLFSGISYYDDNDKLKLIFR